PSSVVPSICSRLPSAARDAPEARIPDEPREERGRTGRSEHVGDRESIRQDRDELPETVSFELRGAVQGPSPGDREEREDGQVRKEGQPTGRNGREDEPEQEERRALEAEQALVGEPDFRRHGQVRAYQPSDVYAQVSSSPLDPAELLSHKPPQVLRNRGRDPDVLADDDPEVPLCVAPEAEFPIFRDARLIESASPEPLVIEDRRGPGEERAEPQIVSSLEVPDRRGLPRAIEQTEETVRPDIVFRISRHARRHGLLDDRDGLR